MGGIQAQEEQDTAYAVPMIAAAIGGQLPSHDMAERFGPSFSVGPTFLYRTNQSYLFGLDFNFIYSDKIKNEQSILASISTSEGYIIDGNGVYAEYFLQERGFTLMAKAGKIFPIFGPNQNSGLMLMGSAGMMQHRIYIYSRENTAPQLVGDYKKGYDKLSNGLALGEFVGYMHSSDNGRINFFAGLEFTQAWTKSRRDYDFGLMGKDTSTHFDALWGIKAGWIFPISRTTKREYYYY